MSVQEGAMAQREELRAASDATIEDAVTHADPMVLRGLLYQLTGDEGVAATEVVPERAGNVEVMAVAPGEVPVLRAAAAGFLRAHRDRGAGAAPIGPSDRLPRSLGLTAGVELAESELPMWEEELALDPYARGLRWPRPAAPERLDGFSVLVIGAGMGGLGAAVALKRAGIPFTVVEKNGGVGGTWYENRYPGARVDTTSRSYTHICGIGYEYPNPYCAQPENEKYINWIADRFDVRQDVVFDTEVRSAVWDEDAACWEVTAHGADGPRVWRPNAIISAVGFLSRPSVPEFPGAATFAGPAFHTARWPAGLDLTGKRVAVIGSGCTSYQMVPELADLAAHVVVFQRTPQWVFERPGYLHPYPSQVGWLDRNFPYFTNFTRFRSMWLTGPHVLSTAYRIDPEWTDPLTLSALNQRVRDERIAFLERKLGHRPDLVERMIPPHPPMSARPVAVDDGYGIYDALARADVTLETARVGAVTPHGITTADGREHSVDVLVYATGFRANEFLWPMEVRGRAGVRVEELWAADGPRAYLGTMLPGFPNFFMLYGPNTNPFSLGVVNFSEMMTRFALERIAQLVLEDRASVDVTPEAYWRYNDDLDRREKLRTWSDPRADNYYRNAHGRSSSNCPFEGNEIWTWLRNADPADFVIR